MGVEHDANSAAKVAHGKIALRRDVIRGKRMQCLRVLCADCALICSARASIFCNVVMKTALFSEKLKRTEAHVLA